MTSARPDSMRPPASRTGPVMTSRNWLRVISETITQRDCHASASRGNSTHWPKKSARIPRTTTVSRAIAATCCIVDARTAGSEEKTFSNWSMTIAVPGPGGRSPPSQAGSEPGSVDSSASSRRMPSGVTVAWRGGAIRVSRARPARNSDDFPDPETPVTMTSRQAGAASSGPVSAALRIVSTNVPMRSSRPKNSARSAAVRVARPAYGRVRTGAGSAASSPSSVTRWSHSSRHCGMLSTSASPAATAREVSQRSSGSTVAKSRGRCRPLRQSLILWADTLARDDAARSVGRPAWTNRRASASPKSTDHHPRPRPTHTRGEPGTAPSSGTRPGDANTGGPAHWRSLRPQLVI